MSYSNIYIPFDTETTGFKHQKGHKIIEIGAVKVKDGTIVDTFQRYVDPLRDVPEGAVRVHGITTERVKGEPLFHEVIEDFLDFVGDSTYVAHNAGFDVEFIACEILDSIKKGKLSREVYERFKNSFVIDTLAYSRKTFSKGRHTLDALADRLGVDRSHRDLHGALLDADLLAEVFIAIHGGSQLSLIPNDESFDVKEAYHYLAALNLTANKENISIYKPRPLPPISDEDREAHIKLMERIKEESGDNTVGSLDVWEERFYGFSNEHESGNNSPTFKM